MSKFFIFKFFDKLEDRVRGWFSHYPILYAIVGGAGTVFCWRGLWHIADFVSVTYLNSFYGSLDPSAALDLRYLWDGLISLGIGSFLLLITGLFVSAFIGDHIIASGLRHGKKMAEKTMEELEEEENIMKKVHEELHALSERLKSIEEKLPK